MWLPSWWPFGRRPKKTPEVRKGHIPPRPLPPWPKAQETMFEEGPSPSEGAAIQRLWRCAIAEMER